MYKYQCSKQECGSTWTLNEGCLNGFVLTCPICGKGRGVFVSQSKREVLMNKGDAAEEMTISIAAGASRSLDQINERIEELKRNYSLNILEKDIKHSGNEIICKIKYIK